MQIDERVEPLVRTALDAAVKRSFSKLEAALKQFPDDDAVRKGVELALAIIGLILIEEHQGKPNAAQIHKFALELAAEETWAETTADEVDEFLTRLLSGMPFAGVIPPENVIILSFVVAGYALASLRRDDERWWNHLDRAEAAIEAQP